MVFSREENRLLAKIQIDEFIEYLNFEEKIIIHHIYSNGLSVKEAAVKMNSSFNWLYQKLKRMQNKMSAINRSQ